MWSEFPWDWALTAVGLVGFWLSGSGVWWSWWVNVANQGLWVALALATGQHGFLVGAAFYLAVFGRNAWRATRPRFGRCAAAPPWCLADAGPCCMPRGHDGDWHADGTGYIWSDVEGRWRWMGPVVGEHLGYEGVFTETRPPVDRDCPVCSPETARRRQQVRNRRQRGYSPAPRCAAHALPGPPIPPGGGC